MPPVIPTLALVDLPSHNEIFVFVGQLAAFISATGVVLGVVYKYAVKPLILLYKKLTSMYDKVEGLVAQFEANGGSSMRDSVDRIERTVNLQDSRQRILLGLVPYAVVESDMNGKLVFANRIYLQWTGRSDDEVFGDGWSNTIHHDDRERVRREWQEAVDEHRAYESRFKMVDIHGHAFFVFCRCYPMVDGIDIETGMHNVYGWFAVIYKCDSDVCMKNPDLCPFSIASGTCKGGDHTTLAPPEPRHKVELLRNAHRK